MRFLILSVGSDGDVFPMVSLGGSLASRGHHVTLLGTSSYADVAAQNGIGFIPLSDDDTCASSIEQKWLMRTRYAFLHCARYSVPWNCVAYDVIRETVGEDVMVISVDRPNLWADLFAWTRLGVPVIRVELDLPLLGEAIGQGGFLPDSRVQDCLKARCEALWKRSMAARGIDTGHLRVERLWRSIRRTVPTMTLWPPWMLGEGIGTYMFPTFGFLPPPKLRTPPEEGRFTVVSGRDMVAFVAGTTGTTRLWSRRFFETSAEICRQLECTGLLLGGDEGTEAGWSSGVMVRRRFLPLGDVLKSVSAIVHHGGIGTAAAAIAHGVPQVVIPRVFAQPRNAEWLRRLGVCVVLDSRSYTTARGGAAVREVLMNPRYRNTARVCANRCDPGAALQGVCEYLEDPGVVSQIRTAALRPDKRNAMRRAASGGPK